MNERGQRRRRISDCCIGCRRSDEREHRKTGRMSEREQRKTGERGEQRRTGGQGRHKSGDAEEHRKIADGRTGYRQ